MGASTTASADLFLIGSFGATAVLVHAAPQAELAQPRNVLGGHFLSALVGVTVYTAVGSHVELAGALAVATAIAVMQLTRTVHPPAGATALIAVLGPPKIQAIGYRYAFTPVLLGVTILVLVAVVFNTLARRRAPLPGVLVLTSPAAAGPAGQAATPGR